MSFLLRSLLHVLHFFYHISTLLASWKPHPQPHEISYTRKQVPRHLALVLIADPDEFTSRDAVVECFLESVQRTVGWCRAVGIRKLTVYDRDGLLAANIEQLSQRFPVSTHPHSEDETSEIEYPLTPPPSDVSDSRPLSPVNLRSLNLDVSVLEIYDSAPSKKEDIQGARRRRKTQSESKNITNGVVILHVVSRSSGKPAVAYAAHAMASDPQWQRQQIGVPDLNAILEGDRGLPSPDFMLVHNVFPSLRRRKQPLELHGFPPWQITLTEFHDCSEYAPLPWPWAGDTLRGPEPLSETSFCRGLDEFSGAQMRFGK